MRSLTLDTIRTRFPSLSPCIVPQKWISNMVNHPPMNVNFMGRGRWRRVEIAVFNLNYSLCCVSLVFKFFLSWPMHFPVVVYWDHAFRYAVHFRNRERITFDHLVSMKKPNETAEVRVLRDGEEHNLTVTLRPVSHCVLLHFYR